MRVEQVDEMPLRDSWAWLRDMLDNTDDVLKFYCEDDGEVRKIRAACHNWSYRFSHQEVVTSTEREDPYIILYVRKK